MATSDSALQFQRPHVILDGRDQRKVGRSSLRTDGASDVLSRRPGKRLYLTLRSFRRKIEAGQSPVVHGDGSQRRDLARASDAARAVELALSSPGPGSTALNLGTGRSHSLMEMPEATHAAALAEERLPANPAACRPPPRRSRK